MFLTVAPFSIPASAEDAEQVAEGGGSAYVMPKGDHTGGSAVAATEMPLMMPGGDAAYKKMKDDIAKMRATGGGDRELATE